MPGGEWWVVGEAGSEELRAKSREQKRLTCFPLRPETLKTENLLPPLDSPLFPPVTDEMTHLAQNRDEVHLPKNKPRQMRGEERRVERT
jgi:hypothetical protein